MVWSLITFANPTYGSVLYPTWGTAVGWCMIIFCVIWIPIVAIVKIVKAEGNIVQVRAKNRTVIASNLNFFGIIRTTCAFFSNTSTTLTCFSNGFLDQSIISGSCIKVASTLPCSDKKINSLGVHTHHSREIFHQFCCYSSSFKFSEEFLLLSIFI